MKLLLTAFDPFDGETINPALEAVKKVNGTIGDVTVVKQEIPTVFGAAIDAVLTAMEREKPDAVLCIGQAGGQADLSPERVAINIDDARIPDNTGKQPIDEPIFADGPAAYFSTLPIKAMVREIKAAGIPASVSNSAGTFVCNHLMYGVLYHIHHRFPSMKGGFLHVPYVPEQAVNFPGAPSMALGDIVRGIEAAVTAIEQYENDIKETGGREF